MSFKKKKVALLCFLGFYQGREMMHVHILCVCCVSVCKCVCVYGCVWEGRAEY